MAVLGLTVLSLNTPARAAAALDLRALNKKIAGQFVKVMGGCPERLWPGYSWKKLNVVLIDGQSRAQVAVFGAKMTVGTVAWADVPEGARSQYYSFYEAGGQAWMSMNTAFVAQEQAEDATPESVTETTFKTAVHEAFHHLGQAGWTHKEGGARGSLLPLRWEPRYQRTLMLRRLTRALKQTGDLRAASLDQAASWFQLWKKESPYELRSSTDGYEGTAAYVEQIAFVLAGRSCALPERDLLSLTAMNQTSDGVVSLSSLDAEGYVHGARAALLLRGDAAAEGWQARVSRGETPVEILLAPRIPRPDQDDEAYLQMYQRTYAPLQAEAELFTAPVLRRLADPASVIVSVPYGWRSGSYAARRFYYDVATGIQLIVLGAEMKFGSPDGRSRAVSANEAVATVKDGNPCRERGWQFVVEAADLVAGEGGGPFRVKTAALEADLRGQIQADAGGHRWFCAGQDEVKK